MIKLLVLSACVCIAYAATSRVPLVPKPEKFKDQEGCYLSELDEVIPFGQSKPSKTSCLEYRCGPKELTYVTCNADLLPSDCKFVKDKDRQYPDCCKKVWCPV